MNKLFLILLGSCTYLSLMLISSQPAKADNSTSIQYVEITKSKISGLNPTSLDDQSINNDDKIGDLAVSKFGCDCAGCRQAVVQLLGSRLILR